MLWLELKEVENVKIHSNNGSGVAEWGVIRAPAKIWTNNLISVKRFQLALYQPWTRNLTGPSPASPAFMSSFFMILYTITFNLREMTKQGHSHLPTNPKMFFAYCWRTSTNSGLTSKHLIPGSMQDTGCLGLVHRDDPEGWYGEGGGFRMGNTCIPVADLCWYMAKPIKYCKVKK